MNEDDALESAEPEGSGDSEPTGDEGEVESSGEDRAEAIEEQNHADHSDATEDEELSPAEFQNLVETDSVNDESKSEELKLDVILDVPVSISMEIGRTLINIRNLLQLNQGSVVELDRLAGEPMDVLINGTLIAHGEVVVVNDKFGIRLTDVISPAERVKNLQ